MKSEIYKNWRITTERDLPSCCGLTHYTDIVKLDLSTPDFKFGIKNYARISYDFKDNETFYYVEGVLFDKHYKVYLQTSTNEDNYHSLIDEANDIIYMWFSQLKKEITKSIKMLQQN